MNKYHIEIGCLATGPNLGGHEPQHSSSISMGCFHVLGSQQHAIFGNYIMLKPLVRPRTCEIALRLFSRHAPSTIEGCHPHPVRHHDLQAPQTCLHHNDYGQ
ncbi:hypothetical protein M408DRAFT_191195 [Serendipita vermifera MAFF 305830]|uniref:Uncharacterized protein n=1 Tax=Serendipita vermifera MAFF 305830 TaxID=933852 RepID=A0A0C2X4J3_SERVB|nr:hypothetical protein M408DRAFT_191195 [Serendipita vermifera MAFF 305830]